MVIKETKFTWIYPLIDRPKTQYIVIHHRAGNGDVASLDKAHKANNWAGIGYHFYVRKDGSIYRGRPINKQGAHCAGYNDSSVGVCFEGNFENEKMYSTQLSAGKQLISYLLSLYPNARVKLHKNLYATSCPGENFPTNELLKGVSVMSKELTSANDIIWELMHGKLKVPITDVNKAVKALDKAISNDEYSSLYWILRKIVNNITN